MLTYAVLPDPVPALPGSALHAPAVVCSGDPQRPGPVGMHAHHVAAHAVRHLAYLAGTDPTIIAIADADGPDGCWATDRSVGARTPAATHVAVHRLAGRRPAPC
ncbi:MAG: hypothetical protein H0X35_14570 [Pseudonocardiales bacterium]|nr:hypothetical protein [Pseudonocardiales bacterium]